MYDMVVCTHWLATLPIDFVTSAIETLHRMARKAIVVVEPFRAATPTVLPLRPYGWDRLQWCYALRRNNGVSILFAAKLKAPDGTFPMTFMHSSGHGVWEYGP